ncbi:hypothetical protein [Streptomyces cucumeris]|uniref:hypothetical protein n=1 Tax=Streptomyces cucumeris TaxID=2962890 RepID=UPI003D724102
MAATETQTPARTAHIRAGYHPEDAFTGVSLTPPPANDIWFKDDTLTDRYGRGTRYRYWYALDLNTGELWYGDTDYRQDDEHLIAQLPGYLRKHVGDRTAPPNGVITRLISPVGYHPDHGYELHVLTAEELYEVAVGVLPIAQRIVETMHRVGPRGELEWSAAADTAWHDFECATEPTIGGGTITWPEPVIKPVPKWCHEAAEFLERHPELIPAEWATASDDELDRIAAYHPKGGYGGVAGYLCTSGDREIYDGGWGGHTFLGDRTALYAYRAKAAGDRTATPAQEWLVTEAGQKALTAATAEYGPLADQHDDQLAQTAARLQAAATVENLLLHGLDEQLRHRRGADRSAVEDLLRRQGAEVARLQKLLDDARKLRRPTFVRVLGWSSERTDRVLGELAGMSHTAVGEVRRALEAAEPDEQA